MWWQEKLSEEVHKQRAGLEESLADRTERVLPAGEGGQVQDDTRLLLERLRSLEVRMPSYLLPSPPPLSSYFLISLDLLLVLASSVLLLRLQPQQNQAARGLPPAEPGRQPLSYPLQLSY